MQWKIVWQLLKKSEIELSYDPVIPLLGIHPKRLKAESQTDICTLIFTDESFVIAKLNYPSRTTEQHSALKRKILTHATTQMTSEAIKLS